jgi:apolipoprotein N-acyltransferase
MGVNICYEAIHPNFMTGYKNQGANVLINLTNDSWFGQTFEPYQHMYMTLARAIELRLPLIRSTNTGITTAIGADGQIQEFSPIGKDWTGVFSIQVHSKPPTSLYQKFARFVPLLLVALCALSILQIRRHDANNKAS